MAPRLAKNKSYLYLAKRHNLNIFELGSFKAIQGISTLYGLDNIYAYYNP